MSRIKINDKYESLFTSKARYHIILGGRGCFHGDTKILSIGGSKKISDIRKGDMVLCYSEENNGDQYKYVSETFKYIVNEELIKVRLTNGSYFISTKDHMFYSGGGWESLYDLVSLWDERNLERNTELQSVSRKLSRKSKDDELEKLWKNCSDETSFGRIRVPQDDDVERSGADSHNKGSQASVFRFSRSSRYSLNRKSQKSYKNRQSSRKLRVDDASTEHPTHSTCRIAELQKRISNRKLYIKGKGRSRDKGKVHPIQVPKKGSGRGVRRNSSDNKGCFKPSELGLAEIAGYEYINGISEVYDICVDLNHNYYLDCGKPILVHNSGKSFSATTYLTLLLKFESGHKILFTRYTMTAAEKSIIPEFRDKIKLLGLSDEFIITKKDITHKLSGSSIFFSGIKTSSGDQTANLKSLHGVTTLVVEEAEELVDEDVFDKIDLSVRVKSVQNRIILIMNPATKTHWIYERFFEKAGVNEDFSGEKGDVNYILTTYLDNSDNLDKSFVRVADIMKETNPEKYNHVMLGAWLPRAEGVIFTNWVMGGFEYIEGSTYFGQDYGFSVDPTTLVKVSIDRLNKTVYLKECFHEIGLSTSEIAERNYRHAKNDLIYVDSAEPRLIKELKDKGMNLQPVSKPAGSILAGIKMIQDMRIIVDPASKNLIKELNNYTWHPKKDDEPRDMYNHQLDAVRYVIYSVYRERKRDFFAG